MPNTMKLDFEGFEYLLSGLEEMGVDAKQVADRALREAAIQIQKDTVLAAGKANLPAHGIYSKGYTDKSIIHFPPVEWEGMVCSAYVGFDFSKPGAGGFLISGTPTMRPDEKLHRMYKGKKYIADIQHGMLEKITEALIETEVQK